MHTHVLPSKERLRVEHNNTSREAEKRITELILASDDKDGIF